LKHSTKTQVAGLVSQHEGSSKRMLLPRSAVVMKLTAVDSDGIIVDLAHGRVLAT
jgi:hypothetical protein